MSIKQGIKLKCAQIADHNHPNVFKWALLFSDPVCCPEMLMTMANRPLNVGKF